MILQILYTYRNFSGIWSSLINTYKGAVNWPDYIQKNQNSSQTDPTYNSYILKLRKFASCIDKLLPEWINRTVFTRMKEINPNMPPQHGFIFPCCGYAFIHVDLYQGLQRVCSCYVNMFIFLSVYTAEGASLRSACNHIR